MFINQRFKLSEYFVKLIQSQLPVAYCSIFSIFFHYLVFVFMKGFCCSCDHTKNDLRQPCEGRDTKDVDLNSDTVRPRVERDLADNGEIRLERKNEFESVDKVENNTSSRNIEFYMEGIIKNGSVHYQKPCAENDFITLSNPLVNSFKSTEIPENLPSTFQNLFFNTDVIIKRHVRKMNKNNEQFTTPIYLHYNNTIPQKRLKSFINNIKRYKKRETMTGRSEDSVVRKRRSASDIPNLKMADSGVWTVPEDQSDLSVNNLPSTNCTYTTICSTVRPIIFHSILDGLWNVSERTNINSKMDSKYLKQENESYNDLIPATGPDLTRNLTNMEDILLNIVPLLNMDVSENTNIIPKDSNITKHVVVEVKKSEDHANIPKCTASGVGSDSNNRERREVNVRYKPSFQSELVKPAKVQSGAPLIKRETRDKQFRGGQSCCQENVTLPPDANPDTYFESAHCLRFSDLW